METGLDRPGGDRVLLGQEAMRRLRLRSVCAAADRVAQVPKLVPVYGHRYLPAGPGFAGHPVLSVWQTDIIYYGSDLADYIDREFSTGGRGDFPTEPETTVEFWRDLL